MTPVLSMHSPLAMSATQPCFLHPSCASNRGSPARVNSKVQHFSVFLANVQQAWRSPSLHQLKAGSVSLQMQERQGSGKMCGSKELCIVATSTLSTAAPGQPPSAPSKQESDVRVVKITSDTLSLRGRSQERLKFEVEYGLKRGTTDNSYLIKGATATALIDVPDQAFSRAYVEALRHTIDLKSIKYLILGHISPKRTDSLIGLAEGLPKGAAPFQVYCSNPAAQQLKASVPGTLLEKAFFVNIVKADQSLDLGGGHNLQFILTPTPRWPDSMSIYDPANQLLFTNKLFSAHACGEIDFDIGGWEEYGEDWRFFYECMLSPVPKQAEAALVKLPVVAQFSTPSYNDKKGIDIVKADIKYILSSILGALNLPISKAAIFSERSGPEGLLVTSAICPLHGPIVRSSLTELVRGISGMDPSKAEAS